MSPERKKIAFICIHNSCRSQIAEALGNHLAGDVLECYSAGTALKDRINPDAVRILKAKYGLDMEAKGQHNKLIGDIPEPDIAISMGCGVTCPFVGRPFDEDWGLPDPTGKPDEFFEAVIQEIEKRILEMRRRYRRIESERLYFYPTSDAEMAAIIEAETSPDMRQAYSEMLQGCLEHPEMRDWYAVWLMELKERPGTIVGDFCFKGLGEDGIVEIGYGLREGFCHQGYMTEALKAMAPWALSQPNVTQLEAETEPDNLASQKVLGRAGFVESGVLGQEGPRYIYRQK